MSNPLEDYLATKPKTKTAFLGMSGSSIKNGITMGAEEAIGKGVVGLAATGIGIAALKTMRALGKARDFKNMMALNPDLVEYHDQNPAQFNAHYNSLRAMAPAYGQDPVISGTLMRQMNNSPMHAGGVLMSALEGAQKSSPSFTASMDPLKVQGRF
jgi:hypothetical protein